jgi:hypothetical protein
MQPMFIFQQTRIILSKHVISSDSIASTVLGGDDNRMQTPAQLLWIQVEHTFNSGDTCLKQSLKASNIQNVT